MENGLIQYSQTSLIRPIGPWAILAGLENSRISQSPCIQVYTIETQPHPLLNWLYMYLPQ